MRTRGATKIYTPDTYPTRRYIYKWTLICFLSEFSSILQTNESETNLHSYRNIILPAAEFVIRELLACDFLYSVRTVFLPDLVVFFIGRPTGHFFGILRRPDEVKLDFTFFFFFPQGGKCAFFKQITGRGENYCSSVLEGGGNIPPLCCRQIPPERATVIVCD